MRQMVTPGPSGPPAGGHQGRWLATIAILVVALIADVLLLVTGGGASPWASSWDPRVLSIVQFVEAQTGLNFQHPVKFEFLDNAAFDAAVTQEPSASDQAANNQALGALRALGLVTGNVNLGSSEHTLESADVIGEYRDDTKTVYVRGATLTPYVRVTLAHELTHALQDQYFDLAKIQEVPANDDSSAVTALVEGDAVRIQNLYQAALSPHDQQLYQQESNALEARANGASSVPKVLGDFLSIPYVFGPTYVDSLDAAGGNSAIDAAFRNPPTTQAQILDPVSYPANWKAVPVDPPSIPAGANRLQRDGPFGQISLFQVLGSRLGYDTAWGAVQGWQGDNSVIYRQSGRTCVAIAVRMASSAERAALASASGQWAAALPGASATVTGPVVTLRSCDPGATGSAVPDINPSAFDVLSARSEVIDSMITEGNVGFATGQCVADQVMSSLGPSNYSELTAPTLSSAQQSALRQLVESADTTCRNQSTT
jgi:hypothetical protein